MEEIIIPSGIKIGSYNDDYTGVTVIMCEKGAVAGVDAVSYTHLTLPTKLEV